MLKKLVALSLSALTCFVAVTSPIGDQSLLSKLGVSGVDVVSHATGGGGGGVTPVDPIEQEEDPGVPIPDEDRALPYESDLVSGIKYDNEFGFLKLRINEGFLEGKFVNQIRYIGIKDKKYEYSTINKDKSHWYDLFIPYKYVEPGINDVYFYMDDATYKVALILTDEFVKEKIAPRLISLENVHGTNVTFEIKLIHNSESERQDFYNTIRDHLQENLTITEIFTMGTNLRTEIAKDKYDLTLDEQKDILSIQFKDDYKAYQFNVHRIVLKAAGYNNSYVDVILYSNSPAIKGTWQTDGDNSLKLTYESTENTSYFREVDRIKLIKLNDSGESVKEQELEEDVHYSAFYDNLTIISDVFEPFAKYKLVLSHPKTKTLELEVTAPENLDKKPGLKLYLNDIRSTDDLVIRFAPEDKNWLSKLTKVTLLDKQYKKYEVKNIQLKENDQEDPSKKKYYILDLQNNTMTIPSKYIHRTE